MKILLSIIINALILYALTFLLWEDASKGISSWIIVEWWITTYIIWWVILWVINVTIKPILKILSLPFFFLFYWIALLLINGIILRLLDYFLNDILVINWVSYHIDWWVFSINFLIAVAIFTILNMFYSILFSKK